MVLLRQRIQLVTTISLSIPIIVAVAGGIVHLALPGKLGELGRLTFACGLLAALLHLR